MTQAYFDASRILREYNDKCEQLDVLFDGGSVDAKFVAGARFEALEDAFRALLENIASEESSATHDWD